MLHYMSTCRLVIVSKSSKSSLQLSTLVSNAKSVTSGYKFYIRNLSALSLLLFANVYSVMSCCSSSCT